MVTGTIVVGTETTTVDGMETTTGGAMTIKMAGITRRGAIIRAVGVIVECAKRTEGIPVMVADTKAATDKGTPARREEWR